MGVCTSKDDPNFAAPESREPMAKLRKKKMVDCYEIEQSTGQKQDELPTDSSDDKDQEKIDDMNQQLNRLAVEKNDLQVAKEALNREIEEIRVKYDESELQISEEKTRNVNLSSRINELTFHIEEQETKHKESLKVNWDQLNSLKDILEQKKSEMIQKEQQINEKELEVELTSLQVEELKGLNKQITQNADQNLNSQNQDFQCELHQHRQTIAKGAQDMEAIQAVHQAEVEIVKSEYEGTISNLEIVGSQLNQSIQDKDKEINQLNDKLLAMKEKIVKIKAEEQEKQDDLKFQLEAEKSELVLELDRINNELQGVKLVNQELQERPDLENAGTQAEDDLDVQTIANLKQSLHEHQSRTNELEVLLEETKMESSNGDMEKEELERLLEQKGQKIRSQTEKITKLKQGATPKRKVMMKTVKVPLNDAMKEGAEPTYRDGEVDEFDEKMSSHLGSNLGPQRLRTSIIKFTPEKARTRSDADSAMNVDRIKQIFRTSMKKTPSQIQPQETKAWK